MSQINPSFHLKNLRNKRAKYIQSKQKEIVNIRAEINEIKREKQLRKSVKLS